MPTRLAPPNSINLRIESLLTDYLYRQGHLTLPGIGVIRYDGVGEVEHDEDSGRYMFPPGCLTFEHASKTELDEELVMHISRETGKMKSLAGSDLESFLHFGQELINISKPFHIKGLGVLQKSFSQSIEFIPEDPSKSGPEKVRRNGDEARRQKGHDSMLDTTASSGGVSIPRNAVWALGLLMLLFGGYALFKGIGSSGLFPSISGKEPSKESKVSATDSTVSGPDAASKKPTPPTMGVFNIVLENANRDRALRRYADLKEWGHDVRMATKDSQQFKLFIPINAPLSDTAFHRDSLRIFFGRPVRVETNVNE